MLPSVELLKGSLKLMFWPRDVLLSRHDFERQIQICHTSHYHLWGIKTPIRDMYASPSLIPINPRNPTDVSRCLNKRASSSFITSRAGRAPSTLTKRSRNLAAKLPPHLARGIRNKRAYGGISSSQPLWRHNLLVCAMRLEIDLHWNTFRP